MGTGILDHFQLEVHSPEHDHYKVRKEGHIYCVPQQQKHSGHIKPLQLSGVLHVALQMQSSQELSPCSLGQGQSFRGFTGPVTSFTLRFFPVISVTFALN